ncbi:MAG: endolytic transglycosylase MltG [Clostridia bacterium]|nr:endolytic transglycosylase MltG [Clostridia bacterium]
MDKRNFDDGWTPTDYEIYTIEEEPKVEKPAPKPAKKAPQKRKKNSKGKTLVATIITAIIVIAALLAILHFFLPQKENVYKFFTNEGTTQAQTEPVINTVKVTFPEGYTIYQYAQLLQSKGVCSKEDFYKAANTPVEGLTIPADEERVFLLEGYLFPDTYEFYKDEPAESVVKRFIDNYKAKVTDEMQAKAEELGYTMDEMLTLASIIQKECDYGIDECRNVSSVFHNRLKESKDTYLGSDVTYFYLKNMADYLGGSESPKFDNFLSLYYTYSGFRKGLPSGPVCNPGLKAIEAAVSPNETNYHFFLTDKDGVKFYYAETFEQHQQNYHLAGLDK